MTRKEKKRFPIYAGMKGNTCSKITRIGYKIIEFTYDVNPQFPDDKQLISEREISRKIQQ